jgi:hypothetical protein
MFNSFLSRLPILGSSGRIVLSTRISDRIAGVNSSLPGNEIQPVVPQISASHSQVPSQNPLLISSSSTSNTDENPYSVFENIRNSIVEPGECSSSRAEGSSSVAGGSTSLALTMKSIDKMERFELSYRYLPEQIGYIDCTFNITKSLKKKLKDLSSSIFSSSIPFYSRHVLQHSNLGAGMRSLVNEKYGLELIEALSFYKGKYGRVIILVGLGVCCTVWYLYVPGCVNTAPLPDRFPRLENYEMFWNPNYVHNLFSKACYIEKVEVSRDVMSTFENEYPFSNMQIPSSVTGDKRIAIAIALMVAVFMGLAVAPIKEQI